VTQAAALVSMGCRFITMLSPSRGPERLVRAGQWTIAVLFAWFLIQVGASLIADLPLLSRAPQPAQFRQASALQPVQERIAPLQAQQQQLQLQLGELTRRRGLAQENLSRERQSFETWRAARAVTAQSDQNPEVLQRARQLDALLEQNACWPRSNGSWSSGSGRWRPVWSRCNGSARIWSAVVGWPMNGP